VFYFSFISHVRAALECICCLKFNCSSNITPRSLTVSPLSVGRPTNCWSFCGNVGLCVKSLLISLPKGIRQNSFISERELAFTFAICRRPSVCRLSSLTFVHPTQAIEIFGNVSTTFGTLATCDPSVKILQRSFQGNPSVGG